LLELKPDDVVLEIGTGLGYQAAVLAELTGRVYSVEIIEELAQRAVPRLKRQGYNNVEVLVGNGYSGWPEHAPFHKVIATAASNLIPPPPINQLKAGGRMVIPVGLPEAQQLVVAEKDLRVARAPLNQFTGAHRGPAPVPNCYYTRQSPPHLPSKRKRCRPCRL